MTDRYNGTTKEQRKMARLIAADVLKTMRYLKLTDEAYFNSPAHLEGKDIQNTPLKSLAECRVCARGAMVVSHARLFNEIRFGHTRTELRSAEDVGQDNADLIECAFQRNAMWTSMGSQFVAEAVNFGKKFEDHSKRLRAIMRNVIENKGVFRPPVPKAKKVVVK